jgi:hypothetical protein
LIRHFNRLGFGDDGEAVVGIVHRHRNGAVDAVIVAGCGDPSSTTIGEVWPGLARAKVEFAAPRRTSTLTDGMACSALELAGEVVASHMPIKTATSTAMEVMVNVLVKVIMGLLRVFL